MATNEKGHHPNRCYFDQDGGNLHLNGAVLYLDESGSQMSNTNMTTPAGMAETRQGTVTFSNTVNVTGGTANVVSNTLVLGGMATGIVANGNTQANATALTAAINVVANVAANNNGVLLPIPTLLGQEVTVINTNGTAGKVWPDSNGTGGTINGGSANAAATLTNGKGYVFICTALNPTAWWSITN